MNRALSRRAFLQRGLAWGLTGAGCGALLVACRGRRGDMTTPGLPAALFLPGFPAATYAASDEFPPVIFLHGNGNASSLWLTAAWRFAANGWPTSRLVALDFPDPTARDDDAVPQAGRSGTADQRAQLVAAIATVLARTNARRVVLIGSSRGGNAIRNALKYGGAAPQVSHAILCGTPNHGAYARPGDGNEFNGAGPFLQGLNAGSEVVPGVAFLTIRSDTNDLYAQPPPAGVGYDSPALAGATNVVVPGLDHNETATSERAFAAMYRFLTGHLPASGIVPETASTLNGRVTGYQDGAPTNRGVAGVTVTVYEVDPATGERRGPARLTRTTGPDGAWGPFTTRPDAHHEFVVAAPGEPVRHIFRSPFPRSSPYIGLRLTPQAALADQSLVIFTRPRGYVATGRDVHLLDGQPVPGVRPGLPIAGAFTVPIPGPERAVPTSLNGEALTVRTFHDAVTYAEFHY
jgi:pimeloyl-ACP methyl ester carboxylesterase